MNTKKKTVENEEDALSIAVRVVSEEIARPRRPDQPPSQKSLLSTTVAALSATICRPDGDPKSRSAWQYHRKVISGVLEKMTRNAGRHTKRDQVLAFLDQLAAGRPVTPAMKRQATKKYGSTRNAINRWLRERE
jgi:hypothetical protein